MVFIQKGVVSLNPRKLKYALRKNTTVKPASEKTTNMITICRLLSIPHLVFNFSNTTIRQIFVSVFISEIRKGFFQ